MDYTDYLGVFAVLKAILLVKAVIWPAALHGTAHKHHRRHLTRSATSNFCLIDDVLHKKISFTKTIKQRGPDDEGWRKVFVEGVLELQTKEELISIYHGDGENGAHLGRDATWYAINGEWTWVGMKNDVSDYIRTCEVCQQSKKHRRVPKPPVKPIIANEPLERVEIDFTEFDYADPDSGHRYVLTVVCCCSKFLWVKTFETKHAAPVAQALVELFSSEGYPEILQSDNGKEFTAEVVKQYLKLIGTKEVHSRARHPQTNGQIERLNGTFKNLLRNLTGGIIGAPWTACAVEAAHQYNNKLHATIKRTPFEVFRGCQRYTKLEANGDVEVQKRINYYRRVLQETREANEAAAEKTKKQFEKRNKVKVYEPKETVFVDLGKRTKLKKVMNKVPAIIVCGYAGCKYHVVWLAGVKEGLVEVVEVERIEPFYVRPDSDHMKNISKFCNNIDQNLYDTSLPIAKKGQKRKRDTEASATTPSKAPPTKVPKLVTNTVTRTTESLLQSEAESVTESPKRRSESHFWKLACGGKAMTLKSARRKPRIIDDMIV